MSDVMDLINSSGAGGDSFQFENIGDTLDGTLSAEPRVIEVPNNKGGVDKVLALTIETTDGKEWSLLCGFGGRLTAIKDALQDAGADTLKMGGRLVMKHTAVGEKRKPGFNPPKFYTAAYVPPAPAANSVSDLLK